MTDYNKLNTRECLAIQSQIDGGMCTINGDTAPVTITARQAAILLKAYELVRNVHPNWDPRFSVEINQEQFDLIMDVWGRNNGPLADAQSHQVV